MDEGRNLEERQGFDPEEPVPGPSGNQRNGGESSGDPDQGQKVQYSEVSSSTDPGNSTLISLLKRSPIALRPILPRPPRQSVLVEIDPAVTRNRAILPRPSRNQVHSRPDPNVGQQQVVNNCQYQVAPTIVHQPNADNPLVDSSAVQQPLAGPLIEPPTDHPVVQPVAEDSHNPPLDPSFVYQQAENHQWDPAQLDSNVAQQFDPQLNPEIVSEPINPPVPNEPALDPCNPLLPLHPLPMDSLPNLRGNGGGVGVMIANQPVILADTGNMSFVSPPAPGDLPGIGPVPGPSTGAVPRRGRENNENESANLDVLEPDQDPGQGPAPGPSSNKSGAVVCDLCGKLLLDRGSLSRHKKIHTGEKPYVCPCCTRAFVQSYNLKQHLKTHKQLLGPDGRILEEYLAATKIRPKGRPRKNPKQKESESSVGSDVENQNPNVGIPRRFARNEESPDKRESNGENGDDKNETVRIKKTKSASKKDEEESDLEDENKENIDPRLPRVQSVLENRQSPERENNNGPVRRDVLWSSVNVVEEEEEEVVMLRRLNLEQAHGAPLPGPPDDNVAEAPDDVDKNNEINFGSENPVVDEDGVVVDSPTKKRNDLFK